MPDRYLHHKNTGDEDSVHLIVESIKTKIIPSVNKQNDALEQEASRITYAHGETFKKLLPDLRRVKKPIYSAEYSNRGVQRTINEANIISV